MRSKFNFESYLIKPNLSLVSLWFALKIFEFIWVPKWVVFSNILRLSFWLKWCMANTHKNIFWSLNAIKFLFQKISGVSFLNWSVLSFCESRNESFSRLFWAKWLNLIKLIKIDEPQFPYKIFWVCFLDFAFKWVTFPNHQSWLKFKLAKAPI